MQPINTRFGAYRATRLRCSSLSRLFEQRFSLLEASGDQPREHISARINLIKEAISAIDLE